MSRIMIDAEVLAEQTHRFADLLRQRGRAINGDRFERVIERAIKAQAPEYKSKEKEDGK